MFNKYLFDLAVSSYDTIGIAEELDYLLSDYLEGNKNKAFYDFQFYLKTLDEHAKRAYIRQSVFHDELIQYPKLTEI